MDKNITNMNDIIDLDDNMISLKDVNYISEDVKSSLQYEKEFDSNIYSDIFLTLTHKQFTEEESKILWHKVLIHRNQMREKLNRDPGIVVSCLDYLSNIENILAEATIIERSRSQYIIKTNLIDKLTNLFIRAVFDVIIEKEFYFSRRNTLPLSLIMIDIDNFKQVNDQHGHAHGDKVLTGVGKVINNAIRKMDIASRYGGEELAIIMPSTDINEAVQIGERIRHDIATCEFDGVRVTVSIGVSSISDLTNSFSDLLLKADEALYRAKEAGKNRVES